MKKVEFASNKPKLLLESLKILEENISRDPTRTSIRVARFVFDGTALSMWATDGHTLTKIKLYGVKSEAECGVEYCLHPDQLELAIFQLKKTVKTHTAATIEMTRAPDDFVQSMRRVVSSVGTRKPAVVSGFDENYMLRAFDFVVRFARASEAKKPKTHKKGTYVLASQGTDPTSVHYEAYCKSTLTHSVMPMRMDGEKFPEEWGLK